MPNEEPDSNSILVHASRLYDAAHASAVRAANDIHSLIAGLNAHMGNSKDQGWVSRASNILDSLKHSSLDGIDVQSFLEQKTKEFGQKTKEQCSKRYGLIGESFYLAKQALFKVQSPAAAAAMLQEHISPFRDRCLEVMRELDQITGIDRNVSQLTRREVNRQSGRAVEKDASTHTPPP